MTLSLDRQNAYREQFRTWHPNWRPATEVYEAAIRAYLKPVCRVLDLGCGRGGVFEQLGAGVSYPVGCDPDLTSLREHRLPDLPRVQARADALSFRGNTFDLVVCSWLFEHLPDPLKVFAEVKRILAPGGAFIFLTPNGFSPVALLNRTLRPLQRTLVPRLYGRAQEDTFPVYYRANSPRQIARLAEKVGFRVEALRKVEDPTYLAFTPLLFRLSIALARITAPVHLVGVLISSG
ncbi:MAG TPA: class I SAM-dependent methyltransferase [Aggregatilineales bacterium]|nr:class I SAM-dependent methyltransferase [Aggregatilineales bacterium]